MISRFSRKRKLIVWCMVAEVSGDPGLGYDPDNDAEEFADREREHVLAFGGMTRLSCFAHTIQLVLLKFNKDKRVAAVLKKVTSVVKKFNMSKNATEQLVNEAGVKLLGVCPMRWSSTYLVIERLLRVQESLTKVMTERRMDATQLSQWDVLDDMYHLLQPFADLTTLTSAEFHPTLSSVIPSVMLIKKYLKEVVDKKSSLSCVAKDMLHDTESRLNMLLDHKHKDH